MTAPGRDAATTVPTVSPAFGDASARRPGVPSMSAASTDALPTDRAPDVEDLGGNLVRHLGAALDAAATSCTLADHAYRYEILVLPPGAVVRRPELCSAAGWCVHGAVRLATGTADGGPEGDLGSDTAFVAETDGLVLRADAPSTVLLAGVGSHRTGTEPAPFLRIAPADELHRVTKPWGEELWINGRHPGFAFKRIRLHAGHRTSLQYHEFKRETNLLVRGEARLHHAEVAGRHDGPVLAVDLAPVSTVDVAPPVLHRIEAVSDIELFEVSTPHLDDVIRVEDDAQRPDGLVASEHERG